MKNLRWRKLVLNEYRMRTSRINEKKKRKREGEMKENKNITNGGEIGIGI